MKPAQDLKSRLAAGETVVGVMATDHVWPLLVELCQLGGLDYLVVDREHGSHSDDVVAHVCQVARLAGFPVLMRVATCSEFEVRRALDLGPCGLLLPCIESAAQLDAVQALVRMPPRGTRRPGGLGNYWMQDFQYVTWRDEFEEHLIVIPQIESRAGIEVVDEIAAHPLVTAVGLGPYDLSADMGCCWQPENPDYQAAIRRVRDAADAAGKTVWIGCDVQRLQAEGYTFLWIGSVSGVLRSSLASLTQQLRRDRGVP